MRSITIGFYRANKPVAEQIQSKLEELAAQPRPVDSSRSARIDDETDIVLRNINKESDGEFLLDFTRIRNVPGMPLSDTEGNEDHVDFTKQKKKPAEYAAAIFDCGSRALAIHETKLGITPPMVSKYWRKILPGLNQFRFDPILEKRAADEVMAHGGFSKLSFSLAHLGSPEYMKSLGLTDDQILGLIHKLSSPNISVTFSIDPRANQKTLAVERVREMASAILGLGRKHVKRLALVAEDQDGSSLLVNLLKDRMVFRQELTAEEARDVTHEIRYRAIREGWGPRRGPLRLRYDNVE